VSHQGHHMRHSACISMPDVGGSLKGNNNDVEGGPGDEVEIEVIDYARCIEDTFRLSGEVFGFVSSSSCGGGEGCVAGVEGPNKCLLLGKGGVGRRWRQKGVVCGSQGCSG
jgi:hypothetical protein